MDKSKKGGRRNHCKECIRSHDLSYRKENPEKNKEYYQRNKHTLNEKAKEKHKKDPRLSMLYHAKQRAVKFDVPFDLTLEDINIPHWCPYLETQLKTGESHIQDHSPTLDRIIPSLGYVVGNIEVISNEANRIKNSASIEQLEAVTLRLRELIDERH